MIILILTTLTGLRRERVCGVPSSTRTLTLNRGWTWISTAVNISTNALLESFGTQCNVTNILSIHNYGKFFIQN